MNDTDEVTPPELPDYRRWIGALTRAAMDRRVEEGRIPGRVPLGYRSLGNGLVEPDPITAPLVREAFRMASEGVPLRKISAALAERGLLNSNGRPLGPSALKHILENRFYRGWVRVGEAEYRGGHEALVRPGDPETN